MTRPNVTRQAMVKAFVCSALVSVAVWLGPPSAIAKQHGDCKLTDDVKNICAKAGAKCKKAGKNGRCEQRSGGCNCNISGGRGRGREYQRSYPGGRVMPPPAPQQPSEIPSR